MFKNLLILIVFTAVYLHFYPNEKLNTWLLKQKNIIVNKFDKATDTHVRLKADKIFMDLKSEFNTFNENEIQTLKEITQDRDSVNDFFHKYCQQRKAHAVFHPKNLTKICHTISSYQSLL